MAPNTGKILKDLSQVSNEDLIKLMAERGISVAKEAGCSIVTKFDPPQPFLEFTGNFRPFSFSVPKCKKIMANIDAIAAFAKSDGKATK